MCTNQFSDVEENILLGSKHIFHTGIKKKKSDIKIQKKKPNNYIVVKICINVCNPFITIRPENTIQALFDGGFMEGETS